MYKQEILSYLTANKIKYTQRSAEVSFKCPSGSHKDSNPSFSLNVNSGLGYCFSCGYKTHVNLLLNLEPDEDALRNYKYQNALETLQEEQEELEQPEIFMPPVNHMVDYEVRGISSELLQELGVYYCTIGKYKGRLIFPVKDTEGSVVGFDARVYASPRAPNVEPLTPEAKYLRPTAMKTKNTLYPLDYAAKHYDKPYVILTEGIVDAISLIQLGYQALCNFGLGAPSEHKVASALSLGITHIVNGFDDDAPGIQGWAKVEPEWAKYFKIGKPLAVLKEIHKGKHKDANEYLQHLSKLKENTHGKS